MDCIYTDKQLKYPLTDSEYVNINDVWDFIKNFYFMTYTLHDYRSKLINKIAKKYTDKEFYRFELLVEKLFWNLRDRTHIYFLTDSMKNMSDLSPLQEGSCNDMICKMYNDNSYRSFINKLVLIDDINNKYYYKKIEGSFKIFFKNEFNLYTSIVLFNRNLYEIIMMDPQKIKNIYTPEFYYEYDYPFPNLNFGKPFIQSKKYRIKRIKKMYYDQNSENNWFKLLKP